MSTSLYQLAFGGAVDVVGVVVAVAVVDSGVLDEDDHQRSDEKGRQDLASEPVSKVS